MVRQRRFSWFTAFSLVIGSVLTMWAGVNPVLGAAAITPQGTVRVAFHTFSKEIMDPAQDGTPGLPYHGQMFDWFIGATPEGKLTTDYGALERYESNADATVWTFVLRKGIKWHDGTEMTVDDIKFSLDHYAGPTTQCTQCGAVRTNLDRTEIVDPTTVRMYLKRADVGIPDAFGPLEGNFLVLPKHYIDKVGLKGLGETLGQRPMEVRQARDRPIHRVRGQYRLLEPRTHPRLCQAAHAAGA